LITLGVESTFISGFAKEFGLVESSTDDSGRMQIRPTSLYFAVFGR